jgi:hypothetical protein
MSELERSPPHSSRPFGNEGFELLRQGALAAERASPKPEEHGEESPEEPRPEDLRDRRIRALEADVAALRCSLARVEKIVANLWRMTDPAAREQIASATARVTQARARMREADDAAELREAETELEEAAQALASLKKPEGVVDAN